MPHRSALSDAGTAARQTRHLGRVRARPRSTAATTSSAARATCASSRWSTASRSRRSRRPSDGSRPDRHALVPTAVPDRGARRRRPTTSRCRPVHGRANGWIAVHQYHGAPVRVVLPGRRGDHGRLRRAPALGQAALPVGGDAAQPIPAVGRVPRRPSRARPGRDVPQRVPRPGARALAVANVVRQTARWRRTPGDMRCRRAHSHRPRAGSRTIHV